jgi:lipopolysaccharide export system permease protein
MLGFGVVTGTLQVDLLVDYLDLWIQRGVPLWAVGQLFLFGLGWMAALSVPCGVLVASLVTFGRMSQDLEIVAVKSSGINLFRIFLPPLLAAAGLSAGLAVFNILVLPEMNHSYANLLADIGRKRPTVRLRPGIFNDDFPGFRLLVDSLDARQNRMIGVSLLQFERPGSAPTVIVARRGHLGYTPDGETAVLTLRGGEIHQQPADAVDPGTYRVLRFDQHVIHVFGAGALLERQVRQSRSEREMNTAQLRAEIAASKATLAESRARLAQTMVSYGIDVRLLPRIEGRREAAHWLAVFGAGRDRPSPISALGIPPEAEPELALARLEIEAVRRRVAQLEVEYHKKFALAFACVVFVLVGAPLGVRVSRGGLTVGFLSLVFFLFYFVCLVAGEGLADRLLVSPLIAMWLPNLVLGAIGIWWTVRACEVTLPRLRPRAALAPA